MSNPRFLTAEWRKLIMANYMIDPSILKKYVPAKTELDYFKGNCYVSLVGFLFRNVKVKGLSIPFHINFPEVNLRVYVKYFENNKWKRGVVFISEIVPKPAITFIANKLFKEHYSTLPMRHYTRNLPDELQIGYHWKKKGHWNKLEVNAVPFPEPFKQGSEEEFITEHFWGYSAKSSGRTVEYEVSHPSWEVYKVASYSIDCDFEELYGKDFAFLTTAIPHSVFLAEGSAINIFSKTIL